MIIFSTAQVLGFEDWKNAYGVCAECAVDIVLIDRNTWMDDKCHRHQFESIIELSKVISK